MHSCFSSIEDSDVVTSAFIVRVKGEQAVKAILLLAPESTQMTFLVLDRDKLIQGPEMEMNTKTPKRMYSFASMKNWSILP